MKTEDDIKNITAPDIRTIEEKNASCSVNRCSKYADINTAKRKTGIVITTEPNRHNGKAKYTATIGSEYDLYFEKLAKTETNNTTTKAGA